MTHYKIGSGSDTPVAGDTDLQKPVHVSGSTTIDACDATTGWNNEGDADAEALNTTAGEFKEGTGALNLPYTYSTGTGAWYKTIGSVDLSSGRNYVYVWFYIVDASDLTSSSQAVRIILGTGGYTNVNNYDTANTAISDGWNLLVFRIDNYTSQGGTGLDTSDVDSIKLQVKADSSQATNDMRMDFWRYCTEAQQLIAIGTITFNDSTPNATIPGTVGTSDANGFSITEYGGFNDDSTPLCLWRVVLATAINKTSSVKLNLSTVGKMELG